MDEFIVAEISKNWPDEQPVLLSEMFEKCINFNLKRGYKLHSWRLGRVGDSGQINETIIAVFQLSEKK